MASEPIKFGAWQASRGLSWPLEATRAAYRNLFLPEAIVVPQGCNDLISFGRDCPASTRMRARSPIFGNLASTMEIACNNLTMYTNTSTSFYTIHLLSELDLTKPP